ncbi:MAG: oligosaccharide flippase family protein [Oscillospiraceae bacterium]
MSKSIFKNSIYKLILSTFNLFVPLLVTPYVSSLLNKELYGTYNTANAMLGFFLVFAVFGVYNYGVREISKVRDDKKKLEALFTNLFFFSVITSLATSFLYFLYVMFAVKTADQPTYLLMLIQISGNILSIEWLNEAVENYGFITKKTIVVRLLYIVSIFVFVKTPQDVIPYGLIMSLTVVINNAVSYFYVKKHIRFNFSDFKLTKYIKPLFILLCISNINILYTQLDKIFLGQFVSGISNTEYTLPANITNMIGVMLISLIVVSIPRLSYYVSHNMERDYMALLNKSTRAFFLVLCPACIGLCCLSYEAMNLYTNGDYAYAYPVLQVFALRFLISSLYSIFTNQILYIRGKERSMIKILLVGGVLNTIFDIGLLVVGQLTPVSAIVSTAIAETIMLSIMYWYIRVKVKVPFKLFAFNNMKYLYYSLPFFAITYFIRLLELGVLMNCAIIIPLCGLTYFVILFVTKDDMLFYFTDKIKAKILRK